MEMVYSCKSFGTFLRNAQFGTKTIKNVREKASFDIKDLSTH